MQRVIILGMGRSGEAAARLLVAGNADVTVIDAGGSAMVAARADSLGGQRAVRVLAGANAAVPNEPFDLAVVSPGIPATHPWVQSLLGMGVEVISEVELAWRHCRTPVLAITGSNGKSTVAKFCGEALVRAGLRTGIGANYGTPFSELVQAGDYDWLVTEISSFQLEHTHTFRPRIAVLLNLLPNHLDRHGDMAAYRAAKLRLFQSQRSGDTAVVPLPLAHDIAAAASGKTRLVSFGMPPGADVTFADGMIDGAFTNGARINVARTPFDNPVLGPHAAAAAAALAAAGVPAEAIEAAAHDFQPLPHRMSPVATLRRITFINDSKATNLAALSAAINMCPGPVRLIAGGRIKEKNLANPKELLAKHVASVYLIGEAAQAMAEAWSDAVRCVLCGTLENAVTHAWREAAPSDIVLLSPGCASFDQFGGFEERGDAFVHLVEGIRKEGVQT